LAFGCRADVADLNSPNIFCASSCPLRFLISLSIALLKVLMWLNNQTRNQSSWETI